MQLIPVILCSGAGSRPWSVSQELHPKSFIQLAEDYNLLQKSILRGAMLPGVQKIVTVTNRDIFHKVRKEFNETMLKSQTISFILEPEHHNNAAAVTAAALHIYQFHDEDTLILILGIDDLNIPTDEFQQTISAAIELAESGKLVTFGMLTSATNTKYHYPKADNDNVFIWNSSLFLFRAGTFLQAMKEHRPDILSTTSTCLKNSEIIEEENALILDLDTPSFFSIPENFINSEVIKKSDKTIVVPCDLNWLDNNCH